MKIWVMTSRNLFICFLVAGFILQACREKPSAVSEEAPLITVAYPQQRSVTLYKEYPGYISAWNAVDVVARVSGYLRESRPEAGTLVKQGELLYVIEPTLYENAVKQAEAGVLNARATLDYARNNYTRMKEARSSNAVSEIDLIQARSNMQIAEAALANAEAALNTAQTNLSYCYVRSPYTGHISLTAYAVGGYISGATSPARLSTVYQDSAVYAYFSIEDAQYLTIVENQTFGCRPEGRGLHAGKFRSLFRNGGIPVSEYQSFYRYDYLAGFYRKSPGRIERRAICNGAYQIGV